MTRTIGTYSVIRSMRNAALAALPLLAVSMAGPALADSARSQDYYKDALEWLQKGDGRAALIQLRNAIKEDPDNYGARLLLGRLYLESGNLAAGRKELEIAHNGAPSDETEVFYGRALLAAREYDNVLSTVQESASDPGFSTVKRLIRAQAMFGQARMDDAMGEIEPVLAAERNQPQANLLAARIKAAQDDFQVAHTYLDAALAGNPEMIEAHLMRAQLFSAVRDVDRTLEVLNRASELAPDDPRPKMLRAETLMRMGRLDEALETVKAYQETYKNDVRAPYLLGRIYATQGKYEEADQELRKISEAVRQIPAAGLLSGIVKFQLEQYAQAENALERYVRTAGDEARQARRLIATIQLRTLRPRAALITLEPLVGEDSRDVASLQLAASAFLRVGDLNNAKMMFERVMRYGAPADVRQARSFFQTLQGGKQDVTGRLTLEPVVLQTLTVLDMLRHGEEQEALQEALRLSEENPDNTTVANLVAGIYFARGDLAEARKYLEPALAQEPHQLTLIRTMDRIDIAEGNFDAVEARARAAMEANPQDEQLILRLAQFLAQRGRRDEAVSLLNTKADALPEAIGLRQALIQFSLSLQNNEEARRRADEALAIGQAGQVNGLVLAGDSYMALRDYPAAIDAFTQLASATDQATGALLKLAQAEFQSGDLDAAAATLDRVLAADPNNALAHRSLVSLNLRQRDGDGALAAAERAAEVNPVLGLQLRAQVYHQTNRTDRAIQELRDGLAQYQISELAQQAFRLLVEADRRDEAKELMSSWLVDNPDDPESLQLLSALQIQDRDYESAAAHLERAYSLLPNNPIVLNNLAWVRYELNRPGALSVARRAYRLASTAPAVIDTLGWILVQEGEVEEGVKLLYTANDAAPQVGDIAYHLAYALEKTGKKEDAIAVLERALDPATEAQFDQDRANAEALLEKLKSG
jgi:putative PEP-CTERM system TPR-repeat lipoprotein